MEKSMEAPERIWAFSVGKMWKHDFWQKVPHHMAVEYIRADLAAPSAPAEVEGLVERNLAIAEGQDEYAKRNFSHLSMGGILRKNATTLTALQAENERLREERDALSVAMREIKEAWDWWREDSYDRCSSVVEDAISTAHAKLKGEV